MRRLFWGVFLSLMIAQPALAVDYRQYAHSLDTQSSQQTYEGEYPSYPDYAQVDWMGYAALASGGIYAAPHFMSSPAFIQMASTFLKKRKMFFMARVMEYTKANSQNDVRRKAANSFLEFYKAFPRNTFASKEECRNYLTFLDRRHLLDEYPDATTLRDSIAKDPRYSLATYRLWLANN